MGLANASEEKAPNEIAGERATPKTQNYLSYDSALSRVILHINSTFLRTFCATDNSAQKVLAALYHPSSKD